MFTFHCSVCVCVSPNQLTNTLATTHPLQFFKKISWTHKYEKKSFILVFILLDILVSLGIQSLLPVWQYHFITPYVIHEENPLKEVDSNCIVCCQSALLILWMKSSLSHCEGFFFLCAQSQICSHQINYSTQRHHGHSCKKSLEVSNSMLS